MLCSASNTPPDGDELQEGYPVRCRWLNAPELRDELRRLASFVTEIADGDINI